MALLVVFAGLPGSGKWWWPRSSRRDRRDVPAHRHHRIGNRLHAHALPGQPGRLRRGRVGRRRPAYRWPGRVAMRRTAWPRRGPGGWRWRRGPARRCDSQRCAAATAPNTAAGWRTASRRCPGTGVPTGSSAGGAATSHGRRSRPAWPIIDNLGDPAGHVARIVTGLPDKPGRVPLSAAPDAVCRCRRVRGRSHRRTP